jgi:hypothetical protein
MVSKIITYLLKLSTANKLIVEIALSNVGDTAARVAHEGSDIDCK